MIIIFDLDDTLYDERSYVESGLQTVADFGADQFGWEAETAFRFMIGILDQEGRGAIFDKWLAANERYSKRLVQDCVQIYRQHIPNLSLYPEAVTLLPALSGYPLYLVTDGHKIVQQHKVNALGIKAFFRHIFITHRYGVRNAKPSIYCFERILKREKCGWGDMMYIGDNPAKDFVGLNPLGVHTVRVLTGIHRNVKAAPGYEAHYRIDSLGQFLKLLNQKFSV